MRDLSLPREQRQLLAKWVAPYVSPKLSNIAVVKGVREMTDAELDWAIRDAQQGPRPREGFPPAAHQGRAMSGSTADDRRAEWLRVLLAEHERRAIETGGQIDDPRDRLIAELDLIAERLRASPGFVEPTAEERERSRQELNRWFSEQGYDVEL
jgi:hypothetical protein